jgi:hypothetical protein
MGVPWLSCPASPRSSCEKYQRQVRGGSDLQEVFTMKPLSQKTVIIIRRKCPWIFFRMLTLLS